MVSLVTTQTAIQHWFRPDRVAQLARLVNVLMIIWLAWLLAQLSWLVIPESEQAEEPVIQVEPLPVKQQAPRIDERQIAGWHLFGVANKAQPVKKVVPVDAPETRLKLTLRGVFATEEPRDARAIIGDPKGKEESYSVGDPLPGGAKLSEIYPDRIILERNGRFETLRLPKEISSAGSRSLSHSSARRLRSSSSSTSKAAAFQKYRNEIKQNPANFLQYVRATPAKKGGKFVGFRLHPGKEGGAMKELGLQIGDIVTSINGVSIDSPAKGVKAMEALKDGDSIYVTLLRAGKEVSVNLTLPGSD
jgi:general secretion pathway protein C